MKCPQCSHDNPEDARYCSHCTSPLDLGEKFHNSQTRTLPMPIEELLPATTFAGRYHILEELPEGGMGRVYKALDKELDEQVALKLIKPDIAADEKMIQRFRNELKFARKIVHKNVCRMFDLNKDGATYYITMEFVSGEDLRTSLRRMGPLNIERALDIVEQVCEGLIEAHRLRVIHRDLKPQNIMIDREGNARIMDFGIARSLEAKGMTEDGQVPGTPAYMSPEQVEGKKADERSDIYSLGVILYEMFTGRVPFEGNTPMSIAAKHITTIPKEPRIVNDRIPEGLSRIIMKCLEKEKEKRFQKVEELLSEIKKLGKGNGPGNGNRYPWRFVLGSIAVVLIGIAVWFFVWRPKPPPPPGPADYLQAGQKYWDEKNYAEALNQFQKLLALWPENFEGQLSLAAVLKEQGRPSEAIPEFEKAIRLNSADPRPYKSLAEICETKQDLPKSIEYYQEYLKKAPEGPESQKITQKVEELQKRLIPPEPKPKPPDLSVMMNAGMAAYNRGEYDLCIQQMEKILKLDPGNPTASRFLNEASARKRVLSTEKQIQDGLIAAQKAFQEKDFQKCIDEAKRVLELDKENAEAKKHLNLASIQVVPEEIKRIVNQYIQAFNSNNLLSFYQEACSPALFQNIRGGVEKFMNNYDRFESSASDVTVTYKEINQWQVSFSCTSQAYRKQDGRKETVFEGIHIWQMEKQGETWKIVRIDQ